MMAPGKVMHGAVDHVKWQDRLKSLRRETGLRAIRCEINFVAVIWFSAKLMVPDAAANSQILEMLYELEILARHSKALGGGGNFR